MSFLNNALKAFGVRANDDDRYDNDEYDREDELNDEEEGYDDDRRNEDYIDTSYKKSTRPRKKMSSERHTSDNYSDENTRSSYSTAYDSRTSNSYNSSMSGDCWAEVSFFYPSDFDKSKDIVASVKRGKITIFDVSQIESIDVARRIVDYIGGAAEGMECPFSMICPSIFCIAPKGVKISNSNRKIR